MIRQLLNLIIKDLLHDLFSLITSSSVNINATSDILLSNSIFLQGLRLRSDIFDIYFHPLRLFWGNIGKIHIDGIAECMIGAPIKINIDDVNLLLAPNTTYNIDFAQTLKKALVELLTSRTSSDIIRDLIYRALGKVIQQHKSHDIIKQSHAVWKSLKYLLKNVNIVIKSIHIRIESSVSEDVSTTGIGSRVNAIGLTIPVMKIAPNRSSRAISSNSSILNEDMWTVLAIKDMQLYVDYDVLSYIHNENVDISSQEPIINTYMVKVFVDRWRDEVHTAFLQPLDIEILIVLHLSRHSNQSTSSGINVSNSFIDIVSTKISSSLSNIKITCDPKQLAVLCRILELFQTAKRNMNRLLLQSPELLHFGIPVRANPVNTNTSFHLLPHFTIARLGYPEKISLASMLVISSNETPLRVAISKSRPPAVWPKIAWQYAIQTVLLDVRTSAVARGAFKGSRRWRYLCGLAWDRRDYALSYSRLLTVGRRTGSVMFDKAHNVGENALERLHVLEMRHDVRTIAAFRRFAEACAVNAATDSDMSKFTWADIVMFVTALMEHESQPSDVHLNYATATGSVSSLGESQRWETESVSTTRSVSRSGRRKPAQSHRSGSPTPSVSSHIPDDTHSIADNQSVAETQSVVSEYSRTGRPPVEAPQKATKVTSNGSSSSHTGSSMSRMSFGVSLSGMTSLMSSSAAGTTEPSSSKPTKSRFSLSGVSLASSLNSVQSAASSVSLFGTNPSHAITTSSNIVSSMKRSINKVMNTDNNTIQMDDSELDFQIFGLRDKDQMTAFATRFFGYRQLEVESDRMDDTSSHHGSASTHGGNLQQTPVLALLNTAVTPTSTAGVSVPVEEVEEAVIFVTSKHRLAIVFRTLLDTSISVDQAEITLRTPREGNNPRVDIMPLIATKVIFSIDGASLAQQSGSLGLVQIRLSAQEFKVGLSVPKQLTKLQNGSVGDLALAMLSNSSIGSIAQHGGVGSDVVGTAGTTDAGPETTTEHAPVSTKHSDLLEDDEEDGEEDEEEENQDKVGDLPFRIVDVTHGPRQLPDPLVSGTAVDEHSESAVLVPDDERTVIWLIESSSSAPVISSCLLVDYVTKPEDGDDKSDHSASKPVTSAVKLSGETLATAIDVQGAIGALHFSTAPGLSSDARNTLASGLHVLKNITAIFQTRNNQHLLSNDVTTPALARETKWQKLIQKHLPKTLTVCIRTSVITAEVGSCASLRALIQAREPITFAKLWWLDILSETKLGADMRKGEVSLQPLVLEASRVAWPAPQLLLAMPGLSVKLPLDEPTFHQYLAELLTSYIQL